eukprot:scaffold14697_cov129-Isochrysis_galbana.AAC.3
MGHGHRPAVRRPAGTGTGAAATFRCCFAVRFARLRVGRFRLVTGRAHIHMLELARRRSLSPPRFPAAGKR